MNVGVKLLMIVGMKEAAETIAFYGQQIQRESRQPTLYGVGRDRYQFRTYLKSELRRVETTDKHFGTQMKIVVQAEVKGFFG